MVVRESSRGSELRRRDEGRHDRVPEFRSEVSALRLQSPDLGSSLRGAGRGRDREGCRVPVFGSDPPATRLPLVRPSSGTPGPSFLRNPGPSPSQRSGRRRGANRVTNVAGARFRSPGRPFASAVRRRRRRSSGVRWGRRLSVSGRDGTCFSVATLTRSRIEVVRSEAAGGLADPPPDVVG